MIVYALLTLLGCVRLQDQNIDESFGRTLSSLVTDRPPKQEKTEHRLLREKCARTIFTHELLTYQILIQKQRVREYRTKHSAEQ